MRCQKLSILDDVVYEMSLCHLDLLLRVMGGAEAIEATSEAAPRPLEVNEEVELESCRWSVAKRWTCGGI